MLAGNAQTRFDVVRGQGIDVGSIRRQGNSSRGSGLGQPTAPISQALVAVFDEDSSKEAIRALSLIRTSWGLSSRRSSWIAAR